MKDRCTLLVNSCDAYEDTWYPFFKILTSNWEPIPYPIVLNTESKSFSYPGLNIHTMQLFPAGKCIPWGKRLIETLKRIDTEYILFMLDDFFLLEKVEQERIDQCMQWMDEDPEIAVFSFWRTHQPNIQDGRYPHFERRPQDGEYRLNCQAAIWRRDKLISYIRPHESPWDWEILGSIRSRRYPEKFYSAIEGEPYIMEYDWFAGGGVHRGKWTSGVKRIFNEYEIEIDLSKRGVEGETAMAKKQNKKHSIVIRGIGFIKRKYTRFLSLK